MDSHVLINDFLIGVFNEILKIEEIFVSKTFANLSVKEMHVIEAVCNAVDKGEDNRATMIAEKLKITAGSLTTAVVILERKGYLRRESDLKDKRVVRIFPTEAGREAQVCHTQFHNELVKSALENLSEDERKVLVQSLINIEKFFREKYEP